MGYACPVCSVPHADAEHLANHLAFTAMLHGDEHEAWLDEHAPEWESSNPAELGPTVAETVPETEFDQVFEDTTDGHDHQRFEDAIAEQAGGTHRGRGAMTGGAEDVLTEARELTRQMHAENADGSSENDEDDDAEATGESSDTENE